MEEIRTRARLVDPAASGLFTRGMSTLVPRAEIEEVLHRGEYPAPLFLDVARVDGESDEVTAHARLMVGWDEPTLRELLRTTTDTEIRLSFDADELERALEEGDVEAHGLREKMAVLAVAAAAAGAGAGAAAAGPQVGMMTDGGGSSATAPASAVVAGGQSNPLARYVAGVDASQAAAQTPSFTSDVAAGGTGSPAGTPSFTSDVASGGTGAPASTPSFTSDVASGGSGAASDALSRYVANVGNDAAAPAPDALSRYVANVGNDATAQAPSFTSDVAAGGTGGAPDALSRYVANVGNDTAAPQVSSGGSSISMPSPSEGAGIAAGVILLITGAGFMAARSRRTPELPA